MQIRIGRILDLVKQGGWVSFRPERAGAGLGVRVTIPDRHDEYSHSRLIEFPAAVLADQPPEQMQSLIENAIGEAIDLVLQKRDGN